MIENDQIQYKKPELEQFKAVWLTEKSFKLIRNQRRVQKISMVKVVDNLIIEKYGDVSMQKMSK